ncbi:hypothetical protein ACGFYQ_33800 [Streptomyces sp. NPDC048258]|uniref:hypothetical protein n=1 Tax=Streptomyces sp. NPDC048258 TaxID=3365527 RepID=UPI0037233E03
MRFLRYTSRRTTAAATAAAIALLFLGAASSLPHHNAPAAASVLAGDDNRDGVIDEDESGWDCARMGNKVCGADVPPECEGAGDLLQLCMTVAARPAFGWNGPDGEVEADLPDGRTLLQDLYAKPGDPEFPELLAAYDADWRNHH